MHGGVAFGIKQCTDIGPGNSTKGGRAIGWTKDGGTSLFNTLAQGIGQYRHTIDITQLALIRTKAHGGIAFNMLHRLKAFAHGQFNATGTDIQLHIDKLTGSSASSLGMGHQK